MASIDSRNARLEDYTETAEDIKDKIQEIAENKGIEIESGVDTPLSVLNKIDLNTGLFDLDVTDNGDDTQTLNIVKPEPPAPANVLYGVKIDLADSNPETSVTYTDDAVGFNKSYMDFTNDAFVWGSWQDKFPFNQVKPCLFKNGAVVTYLNPDNYAQDTDGNAVDITGADGDVMIEIPKIYYKLSKDASYQYIQISNATFEGACCLAHTYKGVEKDKVYIGAYQATYLSTGSSGIAQSVSGQIATGGFSLNNWRNYAQAQGTGYEQFYWHLLVLLQCLYVIQFKNLNSQETLGYGWSGNSSAYSTCGGLNNKGLYYGTATSGQMKFLGIEDFYGSRRTLIDGTLTSGTKLTIADVTSDSMSYNGSGTNYIEAGDSGINNNGGYTKSILGSNLAGFTPTDISGSSSIYYCDYSIFYSGYILSFGGHHNSETTAGAFSIQFADLATAAGANYCGRLTYCG